MLVCLRKKCDWVWGRGEWNMCGRGKWNLTGCKRARWNVPGGGAMKHSKMRWRGRWNVPGCGGGANEIWNMVVGVKEFPCVTRSWMKIFFFKVIILNDSCILIKFDSEDPWEIHFCKHVFTFHKSTVKLSPFWNMLTHTQFSVLLSYPSKLASPLSLLQSSFWAALPLLLSFVRIYVIFCYKSLR